MTYLDLRLAWAIWTALTLTVVFTDPAQKLLGDIVQCCLADRVLGFFSVTNDGDLIPCRARFFPQQGGYVQLPGLAGGATSSTSSAKAIQDWWALVHLGQPPQGKSLRLTVRSTPYTWMGVAVWTMHQRSHGAYPVYAGSSYHTD